MLSSAFICSLSCGNMFRMHRLMSILPMSMTWTMSGMSTRANVPLHNLPAHMLRFRPNKISATFVKSSMAMNQLPEGKHPEVAFIGHSNVGKSSLLNMLVGSQGLAKVSKQPGKTRCINHFIVNSKLYLVDCPGYGYARVSKEQRHTWHELTQEYLTSRPNLAQVLLLVDASMEPNAMDLDAAVWLCEQQVPWSLVFTKVDHNVAPAKTITDAAMTASPAGSSSGPKEHLRHGVAAQDDENSSTALASAQETVDVFLRAIHVATSQRGGRPWTPPYVLTSSKTGLGRDSLLSYVWHVRDTFKMPLYFK